MTPASAFWRTDGTRLVDVSLSAAGTSRRLRCPEPWSGRAPSATCEVAFCTEAGPKRQEPLTSETASVAFEHAAPVRSFPSYRGQANFPGLWWSATSGRHVGFESWLERDHAMLLDFDPEVVGFSSQPFRLSWWDGRRRSHVPDFFARLADGTGVVVDCRPADHVPAADAEVFGATERACERVGWRYRLVHAPDEVLVANVRWLAGYRHPRHQRPEVTYRLTEAFARPRPLMAGAEMTGDPLGVLPVLYHLLWRGLLRVDLAVALHEGSLVSLSGA